MSISDVLVFDTRTKPQQRPVAASAIGARGVLAGTGAALAVVGWIDWILLWLPPQFGAVEWEFGTIGQSFDALPLATIGTAALIVAALTGGWRRTLMATGAMAFLLAAVFTVILLVFVLDVPILLKGAEGAVRPVLLKAVAKTSLYGVVYTITYAWLGLTCLRALRRAPRGK